MVNLTPAPIEVYSSGGNPAAAAHLANAENASRQQIDKQDFVSDMLHDNNLAEKEEGTTEMNISNQIII